MVRILTESSSGDKKRYFEFAGLSTDTKPTEEVGTGSVFLEVDTGSAYFYDEVGEDWIQAGGGD